MPRTMLLLPCLMLLAACGEQTMEGVWDSLTVDFDGTDQSYVLTSDELHITGNTLVRGAPSAGSTVTLLATSVVEQGAATTVHFNDVACTFDPSEPDRLQVAGNPLAPARTFRRRGSFDPEQYRQTVQAEADRRNAPLHRMGTELGDLTASAGGIEEASRTALAGTDLPAVEAGITAIDAWCERFEQAERIYRDCPDARLKPRLKAMLHDRALLEAASRLKRTRRSLKMRRFRLAH